MDIKASVICIEPDIHCGLPVASVGTMLKRISLTPSRILFALWTGIPRPCVPLCSPKTLAEFVAMHYTPAASPRELLSFHNRSCEPATNPITSFCRLQTRSSFAPQPEYLPCVGVWRSCIEQKEVQSVHVSLAIGQQMFGVSLTLGSMNRGTPKSTAFRLIT